MNRLSLLGDCSACGICNDVCPVYRASREEWTGPRGKVSILKQWNEGALNGSEIADYLKLCVQCGRCARACPAGIPLADIFKEVLASLSAGMTIPQRLFYTWPHIFDLLQTPLALAQSLSRQENFFGSKIAAAVGDKFPPLSPILFSAGKSRPSGKKARIYFFRGCVTRRMVPGLARSVIAALESANYEVITSAREVCCGGSCHSGRKKEKSLAQHNLELLSRLEFDYLVTSCPACLKAIRNDWVHMPGGKAAELAAKTRDIHDFLLPYAATVISPQERICWHHPCTESDPAVLKILAGEQNQIICHLHECCGARLSRFASPHEKSSELAIAIRNNLRVLITACGPSRVVTSCPHCLVTIRKSLDGLKKAPVVCHSIELFNDFPKINAGNCPAESNI